MSLTVGRLRRASRTTSILLNVGRRLMLRRTASRLISGTWAALPLAAFNAMAPRLPDHFYQTIVKSIAQGRAVVKRQVEQVAGSR